MPHDRKSDEQTTMPKHGQAFKAKMALAAVRAKADLVESRGDSLGRENLIHFDCLIRRPADMVIR